MNHFTALVTWTVGVGCLALGGYQGLVLAEVLRTPPIIEGIIGGLLPVVLGVVSYPLCLTAHQFLARGR